MAQWLSRVSRGCRRRQQRYLSPFPVTQLPSLLFFSSHAEDLLKSSSDHQHRTLGAPFHPAKRYLWLGSSQQRQRQQMQGKMHGTVAADWFRRSPLFSSNASSGTTKEEDHGDGKGRPDDVERPPSGAVISSSSSSPTWVDLYLPKSLRPYALLARLDKPIGTWLLAWPCMWSITLAAAPGNFPDLKMLTLFGCGAVLLRGAGCTVNDLLDSDIDKKVTRTMSRPVASGLLTPFQGLSFLGFQLLLGLGILLQLNDFSRILGASSLLLVFSYPLTKRLTFWPQAYLGLTFNWGALLGWAAIRGGLDPAIVIPLYSSGVFWTLVYDTIYAHQDKDDDMKVGVKSTALRFGSLTKNWISGFGFACVSNLAISGFNAELAWPFYAFLTMAAGQLGWQIWTVDLSNRADCNRKFVSNKWFGALIFSGILFGRLAS